MAVDSEGHQAEEDGYSDQRSSGWRREELPILDLAVPQDRQHEDQQGHHHAAHVQRHLDLVCRTPPHHVPLVDVLGDVAVQDTVMGQVQRGQGPSIVLQELALIDEPDLLLLTRKVGPARTREQKRSTMRRVQGSGPVRDSCVGFYLLMYPMVSCGFT